MVRSAGTETAGVAPSTAAPHPEQNFAWGTNSVSQLEQCCTTDVFVLLCDCGRTGGVSYADAPPPFSCATSSLSLRMRLDID